MDIFESLENLSVSEECFDDIMDIVEEILSEEIEFNPFEYALKHNKYSQAKQDYDSQVARDEMYRGSKTEHIQKNKAKSRYLKKKGRKEGIKNPEFIPGYGEARKEVPGENKDPKEVAYNRPRHSSDTSDEFPEYVLYREDD